MERKIREILKMHEKDDAKLLAILHDVQDEFGYVPKEAMKIMADELGMKPGEVYDTASFYSFFRFEPPGEHVVQVCDCIVCHIRGAGDIIKKIKEEIKVEDGETTKDGKLSFEVVDGLGHCEASPVMLLDGKLHGNLTPEKAIRIIKGAIE